ncbi:hypothetical protein BEP19_14865 [Ammoniphilus oxalaticus]|uniref:Uncharacterized protein n=1 Tax=Ammoniphilus oxalaticus TaxID=66863 RepID=A0A419SCZ6_9BACL|nr:hypothetical protein [Ammoniphilus oxalaticus]RKD20965.1 hypothetical protein BEP19_14865 [Ammoniphilus oxalaticus]
MSLFGYPAAVVHFHSQKDDWGRPLPPVEVIKSAKVVEEQKVIKNNKGEEVQVAYEVHIEGVNPIGFDDYFMYTNALGQEIRIGISHYEIRKHLGTDKVKKVIIYG